MAQFSPRESRGSISQPPIMANELRPRELEGQEREKANKRASVGVIGRSSVSGLVGIRPAAVQVFRELLKTVE